MLLHGYAGDGHATFAPQLDGFSNEFTVVVWDAPGSGPSEDPPETYRMADFADRLAGFIEAAGLIHPHVLGLSFGGALALELAHRHPAIPRSLVLVSAYAGWPGSLPPEEVDRRVRQAIELSALPPDRLVEALAPTMFATTPRADLEKAFVESLARFHPSGFRTMARALGEVDLREMLSDIDVPTLLVYGDADVRAALEVGEAIHGAISGSELVVLPGVGHIVSLEAPDRLNEEVRRFLHSVSD